jgi:hypothetical protein
MSSDLVGGCLCGAVRYRAARMARASLCHCRMCQKASGAPVVAWLMVPAEAFAFTQGEPAAYRSSPGSVRHFCGTCGSPLTIRDFDKPSELDINLATLDHPETVAPRYHIHTASQMPWLYLHDGLPQYPAERQA